MHTLVDVDTRLDTIESHLLQLRDDLAWLTNVVERSTRAAANALEDMDEEGVLNPVEGEWRKPLKTS